MELRDVQGLKRGILLQRNKHVRTKAQRVNVLARTTSVHLRVSSGHVCVCVCVCACAAHDSSNPTTACAIIHRFYSSVRTAAMFNASARCGLCSLPLCACARACVPNIIIQATCAQLVHSLPRNPFRHNVKVGNRRLLSRRRDG